MTAGAAPREEDLRVVRDDVLPLTGPELLDPLLERIGGTRFVALGEASHGTAEFSSIRRRRPAA